MDLCPIKFLIWSTDHDFGALYGNVVEGFETCSATPWLVTRIMGGTIGQLSTTMIGGCPSSRCISAKIASIRARIPVSAPFSPRVGILTWVAIDNASLHKVIKDLEMTPKERRRKLWKVGILRKPFVVQRAVKKSGSDEHCCNSKRLYRSCQKFAHDNDKKGHWKEE